MCEREDKKEKEEEERTKDDEKTKKKKKKKTAHLRAFDAWRRCCLPCLPGAVLIDARVGPASVVVFVVKIVLVEWPGRGVRGEFQGVYAVRRSRRRPELTNGCRWPFLSLSALCSLFSRRVLSRGNTGQSKETDLCSWRASPSPSGPRGGPPCAACSSGRGQRRRPLLVLSFARYVSALLSSLL